MKAKEGMRVRVFSAYKKHYLGQGIIEEVGTLKVEGTDLTINDYPFRIVLDSGEVTEGCKCWWIPLGKAGEYAKELK